jgi:hypothetical protein
MKYLCLSLLAFYSINAYSFENKILHDNDSVSISQIKIMPYEEIGLHRDAYPQIVIAIQGGTITRLEADGTKVNVDFPTGQVVSRKVDPPDQFHRSVNSSINPIELIVIQLK